MHARTTTGNFRLGNGEHFVVEGDEYDTAYFDKGPKFLHYRPRTAILTSVEFDHADIYRDLAHYESRVREVRRSCCPQDGFLAVCAAYPNAVRLARRAARKVVTYAARRERRRLTRRAGVHLGPEGARFEVATSRRPEIGASRSRSPAAHNVENALGVYAAARALGLKPDEIADGLRQPSAA